MNDCNYIRGGLAIGGGALIGLGVGFVFLKLSALFFAASLLTGIGLGLLVASFFNYKK